jgi:predicted HTH transcriptional regulator
VSKYIYDLISQGEHQQLDFKFEISDARKIARTLVAFSNSIGGKLLIGVKDNGRIAGVRSEEEYYMIDSAATMYCKPEIIFSSKKWTIEGKTVLEIDIPPGEDKPYLAQTPEGKWMAYLRVNDQNLLANSIQLNVWQNQKSKKGIYLEYKEAEDALLKYLDTNERISFSSFCKLAGISRRKASGILSKLASLNIISIVFTEKQTFYELKKKE